MAQFPNYLPIMEELLNPPPLSIAVILLILSESYTIGVILYLLISMQFKKFCMWTSKQLCFWYWTLFVHLWPKEGLEFKLVGHSIWYWFVYFFSSTITVAFQASISYVLIYFIIILLLQLPPMWKPLILYLGYAMIFSDISPSMPPTSNRKLFQNWKYVHNFRRQRLAYHFVVRFRRNVCQCLQRIDGNECPSPCYVMHQHMKRRNPKAKACHHCQQVIKTESTFQLSGDYHFRFHDSIPPHILDNLCGSRYFTIITKLI